MLIHPRDQGDETGAPDPALRAALKLRLKQLPPPSSTIFPPPPPGAQERVLEGVFRDLSHLWPELREIQSARDANGHAG